MPKSVLKQTRNTIGMEAREEEIEQRQGTDLDRECSHTSFAFKSIREEVE